MNRTLYTIETTDGYRFQTLATNGETMSVDVAPDFRFETESELLQWVTDNIESISSYTATILADNIHGKRD